MDLMAVKRSQTLLKEIESPTEDLVVEGVFYVMLYGRPPTWGAVATSMLELDSSLSWDQADDRIAEAVKSERVRVGFSTEANDHVIFPAQAQDWWKVSLRYLINYFEKMIEIDSTTMDRHTRALARLVQPYLGDTLKHNRLPDTFPTLED